MLCEDDLTSQLAWRWQSLSRERKNKSHTLAYQRHLVGLRATVAQALFVAWYKCSRRHEAQKGKMPAMASNLTDHVWTIKELIEQAAGC